MGTLRHPAPESRRTRTGMTVHRWAHPEPAASPVLLIHGFASSTLFNWVKTGWLDPLAETGRTVLSVDLPGHGDSGDVDPAGLRVPDLLADLAELCTDLGEPVAAHGYSLGSRIAWQFAHDHPQHVVSLVMGGSPTTDEVYRVDADQARAWAAGGPEPADELTRRFITVAAALPGQHLPHVVELRLSLSEDRHLPSCSVPSVPTLVVAGSRDEIAAGAGQLADWVRAAGAPARYVELPGRNHINALTSREYKQAVLDFL